MKIIRWILAKIILFLDRAFAPKVKPRSAEELARIQAAVAGLSMYQFPACPFCVKVRRFLKTEGVILPLSDATREPSRQELLVGGGKLQVPCLKITPAEGPVRWLYESSEIMRYLEREVLQPTS